MSSKNINVQRPKKGRDPIVGFRIPNAEMDEIRLAAIAKSMTYGKFIRQSALRAARRVNAQKAKAAAQTSGA